jgi:hypothetical protein
VKLKAEKPVMPLPHEHFEQEMRLVVLGVLLTLLVVLVVLKFTGNL